MKNKFVLSAFVGVFFAIPIYLLCFLILPDEALLLALFSGLLVYLLLFLFLLAYEKILSNKYSKVEKNIASPIFYKTNGNFNLGNRKIKNGNIYFCDAGIVCIGLEDKPYSFEEILVEDIEQYQFDSTHFNIYTKSGRLFIITLSDAQEVIKILKEKQWI